MADITVLAYRLGDVIDILTQSFNDLANNTGSLSADPTSTGTGATPKTKTKKKKGINLTIATDSPVTVKEDFSKIYLNSLYNFESESYKSNTIQIVKMKNGQILERGIKNIHLDLKTVGDIPVPVNLVENCLQENISFIGLIHRLLESINANLFLSLSLIPKDQAGRPTPQDRTPNTAKVYSYGTGTNTRAQQVASTVKSNTATNTVSAYTIVMLNDPEAVTDFATRVSNTVLDSDSQMSFNQMLKSREFIVEYGASNSLTDSFAIRKINNDNYFSILFVQALQGYLTGNVSAGSHADTTRKPVVPDGAAPTDFQKKLTNILNNDEFKHSIVDTTWECRLINSLTEALRTEKDPTLQEQNKRDLQDFLTRRNWTFITRMFFTQIDVEIHGTMGLVTLRSIIIRGLMKQIEGIYGITDVQHNFSAGKFVTHLNTHYILDAESAKLLQSVKKVTAD